MILDSDPEIYENKWLSWPKKNFRRDETHFDWRKIRMEKDEHIWRSNKEYIWRRKYLVCGREEGRRRKT